MQERDLCERLLILINIKSSSVPRVCCGSAQCLLLDSSAECSFLQLSVFNLQGSLAPPDIMDSLHAQITPRYCAGFANYFLIVRIYRFSRILCIQVCVSPVECCLRLVLLSSAVNSVRAVLIPTSYFQVRNKIKNGQPTVLVSVVSMNTSIIFYNLYIYI